jgi:hypothetical protein
MPPASAAGWYQIELLVFRNRPSADAVAEARPESSGMPAPAGALLLQEPRPSDSLTLVGPEGRALNAHREQMARGGPYDPLIHLAWRQPVEDIQRARFLYFQVPEPETGITTPSLRGTVRVSKGRFLRVDLDVALRESRPTAPRAGEALVYRLRDRRSVRSGDLHYLDHPALGALVMARPIGATTPAIDQKAASTPAATGPEPN